MNQPAPKQLAKRKTSLAPVIITVLIAAIGFAVVASSTSGGAGMYNFALKELVKQKSDLAGKDVKVSGRIAKGSVRGEPASDSFRFDLEDDEGNKISVGYTRLLPDPFEEGRDAIVQGKLVNGELLADNLTVKCPSRYADTEEAAKMSESERKAYYQKEYKKHMEAQEAEANTAEQKGQAKKAADKPASPQAPQPAPDEGKQP